MSFNPNHKKAVEITPDNYEEYFLLYIDDELTSEEKAAVEAFVLLHPDLKEELDGLLETKLPAKSISLPGKQRLLAEEMKAADLAEQLLLYIDNELSTDEKKKIEEELAYNAVLQQEYHLLQKTKLDRTEAVVYPDKEELYHYTEKRAPLPVYWLRIAAAILIVLSASLSFWVAQNRTQTVPPVAAQHSQPEPKRIPALPGKDSAIITQPQKNYLAVQDKAPIRSEKASRSVAKVQQRVKAAPVAQKPGFTDIAQNNPKAVKESQIKEKNEVANPSATNETGGVAINKSPVTSDTPSASTPTGVPTNKLQPDFTRLKEEKKGGTLKVILRKATRFIERRTGIQATNEDDELLIGAVAIQL